ncbi:hypothetical protein Trydic_g365 [Trypoxylus dichotomus]
MPWYRHRSNDIKAIGESVSEIELVNYDTINSSFVIIRNFDSASIIMKKSERGNASELCWRTGTTDLAQQFIGFWAALVEPYGLGGKYRCEHRTDVKYRPLFADFDPKRAFAAFATPQDTIRPTGALPYHRGRLGYLNIGAPDAVTPVRLILKARTHDTKYGERTMF